MIQLLLPQPRSFLIICPWCFDCWARLVGKEEPKIFDHLYIPCIDHPQACHPYGIKIAGSILEALELTLDDLPAEVIKREFQLTMSNLSQEIS
jgi:hypothetical protein